MGLKRWLLALIILIVVLGFIGFFFLQSGADRQISEEFIPKVQERYGVHVTWEDMSVSLSSVSLGQVTVSSLTGRRPFARIERLGVNVRVGPLLLGELDISGIRVDGLLLLAGNRSKGASLLEWRDLLDRLRPGEGTPVGKGADVPEIYLTSGEVRFSDRGIAAEARGLNGRIAPGRLAHLQADRWRIDGSGASITADNLAVDYDFSARHLTADVDRPEFVLPLQQKKLQTALDDLRAGLQELGMSGTDDDAADPEEGPRCLDAAVSIGRGRGFLATGPSRGLELAGVTAEVITNAERHISLRANGRVVGGKGEFVVQGTLPRQGRPELVLELPDLPLENLGPLLAPDGVDWSKARAGGQLTLKRNPRGLLTAEGRTALSGLALKHDRIGSEPLKDLQFALDYRLTFNGEDHLLHVDQLQLSKDLARLSVEGTVHTDRMAFDLRVALPPTACRQVLGAVPEPLRRPLEGVGLEGRMGFEVHLALDAVSPDATVLDGVLDNRCKISDFGGLPAPDDFRRLFAWMAYDDKGNRIRMLSGPGSDHWTAIGAISPYLIAAVLTTEDGKFESHQGLTLPELRTALAMNLRRGDLDHGASTITMQLAKNLFLSRDRTVARKLQELFFTWYLESNFTKDEILELYFNVVEFGPSIYGVGPAARYYFGREPYELNLVESVFLVKLLPSPVARHNALRKEGGVSKKKMASLHRVMQVMFDRHRISDAEYRLGLEQELVFYNEGDPLPEPRLVARRDGVVDLSLPPGAAEDTFAEEFDDWE